MIEVLETLARTPGVRTVILSTEDGVPISCVDRREGGPPPGTMPGEDPTDSMAGLAIGWMGELSRAVAPLSWNTPRRFVLRASRGTLVAVHGPHAILLAFLDRGADPEDLRLPMEGAVGRIQRILRSMGDRPKNEPDRDRKEEPATGVSGEEPESLVRPEHGSSLDEVSLELNPKNAPGGPGN